MTQSEERSLANIFQLVELNIASSYSQLLSNKYESVKARKTQLRQEADRLHIFFSHIKNPTPSECVAIVNKLNATSNDAIEFQLYDAHGNSMVTPSHSAIPTLSEIKNPRNRSLQQITHPDEVNPNGEFVVFTPKHDPEETKLAYFKPYRKKQWTIAAFTPLSDIEATAERRKKKLTESLDKAFANMNVFNSGYIALFEEDFTVLVNSGTETLSTALMQRIITASKKGQKTLTSTHRQKGVMEHRFFLFRPLRWYVMVSAPVSEILKPAEDIQRRMLIVVISVFFCCLLVSMTLIEHTLHPIRTLTRFARRLPEKDFSTPHENDTELSSLPTTQNDEIGDLARSYEFMCHELKANIQNLMDATAAKERIQGELNVGKEIQEGILPKEFPPFPDRNEFVLHAFLEPAKEIGGDLYDFFFLDEDRLCLVLGDVSGKGVPAAIFMAVAVTIIRSTMQEGLPAHSAMDKINNALTRNNPTSMFVSLFIGVLNTKTGQLNYANGGHNPPVIIRNGATKELSGISGLVVGGMENIPYAPLSITLQKGDALFLYTDGITEALNKQQELFGADRLFTLLETYADHPVEQILTEIREHVSTFSGDEPQSDDLTMLLLRYQGHQCMSSPAYNCVENS